jgi:hypothetical protein
MAFLSAEALHVHDGHAKDRYLAQGLLDGLELGRLNDGEDEFHLLSSRRPTRISESQKRCKSYL